MREENLRKIKMLLNASIFIVGLLVVIFICYLGYSLYKGNDSGYGYRDRVFQSLTNTRSYVLLGSEWREQQLQGVDLEDKEEYCAIAEYFEAACYYRVYEELGDTEHADIQWQRMEDAAGRMGEYTGELAEINARLGITE